MRKAKIKEEFSFEKKKKMAAKISTMTNKEQLRKIRDIIFSENQNVSARKNNEGYLMYFQNYTNETYYKIEKYMNKLEKEKIEKQTRALTETSDQMLSSEDPNTDYTLSRSRLRYSNTERRLMKRRDYEKKISENVKKQEDQDLVDQKNEESSESEKTDVNNTDVNNTDVNNEDSVASESESDIIDSSESEQQIKIKKVTRSQGATRGNKLFPELPTIEEKNNKNVKKSTIFSLCTNTKTKKN